MISSDLATMQYNDTDLTQGNPDVINIEQVAGSNVYENLNSKITMLEQTKSSQSMVIEHKEASLLMETIDNQELKDKWISNIKHYFNKVGFQEK